jgi:hypothetical protein
VWWVRESTGERSAGGRHHCAAPHERVVAVAGGQARATDGTVNWQHGFGKDVARFGEEEGGRLGGWELWIRAPAGGGVVWRRSRRGGGGRRRGPPPRRARSWLSLARRPELRILLRVGVDQLRLCGGRWVAPFRSGEFGRNGAWTDSGPGPPKLWATRYPNLLA